MNTRIIQRFWDWKTLGLIGTTLLLILIGHVVLLGATYDSPTLGGLWERQAMWFLIGLVISIGVIIFDFRHYLRYAYVLFAAVVGILLITEIHGVVVYGAKSWIDLPILGARFQPAEIAKLALIILLARVLARKEGDIRGLKDMIFPMILVGIPGLLILHQPDLGTALVFVPITLGMMFMAGMSWVYIVFFLAPIAGFLGLAPFGLGFTLWLMGFFIITALMLWKSVPILDRLVFWSLYIATYVGMPHIWEILKPHQKSRFLVFWDPTYDLDRAGYNLLQSKIAIGSGGFLGKGFGQGTQTRLAFLPQFHTDFTFAVLAEDWGFVGCIVFFTFFLVLLFLCMLIAQECKNFRGSLLVSGVILYFMTHFSVNVGMAMGMLPVTGLPISFLSYGGSHLLASMIGIALVLNVKLHQQ